MRSIDVLEDGRRVLRHTFFGATPTETRAFIRAHRQVDRFLDAAIRKRPFRGLTLRARTVRGRR